MGVDWILFWLVLAATLITVYIISTWIDMEDKLSELGDLGIGMPELENTANRWHNSGAILILLVFVLIMVYIAVIN